MLLRDLQSAVFKTSFCGFLIFWCFLSSNSLMAAESKFPLDYQDNKLTLTASNIDLLELLRKVSEVTRTEIFLFDEVTSKKIDVNFSQQTLEEVLKSLLKGYSYAIVYAVRSDSYGLYSMLIPRRQRSNPLTYDSRKTIGINDHTYPSDYSFERERMLVSKIQSLQERIDSGESDREFKKWAAIRGAQFVVNDRDRLAHYEKQLDELRGAEDR